MRLLPSALTRLGRIGSNGAAGPRSPAARQRRRSSRSSRGRAGDPGRHPARQRRPRRRPSPIATRPSVATRRSARTTSRLVRTNQSLLDSGRHGHRAGRPRMGSDHGQRLDRQRRPRSRPGAPRSATARPNSRAIAMSTAWSRTPSGAWRVDRQRAPGRPQPSARYRRRPIRPPPAGVPPAGPQARRATGPATPRAAARSPASRPPGPFPSLALDGPFGADAAWVGIGGLRSRDLIQAGTAADRLRQRQRDLSGLDRDAARRLANPCR